MVTSPVSSMDTNAMGSKRGTSTGAADGLLANPRGRRRNPITRPPATAAPPMRKLRRLMFSRIAAISRPPCRGLDRRANPLVGAAAADVAGHGLVDIAIGGLRRLGEQAGGLHDLPALAIAALRDVQTAPRRLDALADRCRADSLDRRDLLAFRSRDRRHARARRRAVQGHRARAAEGHATPELAAGESKFIAQRPEQRRVRGDVDSHRFAIDVESGHVDSSRAGGAMNSGPTGSVIAFARMRSMSARAWSSRLQPSTSSIGDS